NPPVYPVVLAGLMKIRSPDWTTETRKPFWSDNGRFMRYQPEFSIAVFNQILLLATVALTFLLARKLFDSQAAWLSALLLLGADQLWKFSVSGLSTMLLLVIFLGLILCLVKAEELGRAEAPKTGSLFGLAVAAGVLTGLGMLTRYSFGMLLVPAAVFLLLYGGAKRKCLPLVAVAVFGVVIAPWLARNLSVSGTLFGTAGYGFIADTFRGSELMQSIQPNLAVMTGLRAYLHTYLSNLNSIFQDGWQQLGIGAMGVLFFAGLLLGLRSVAARRLRYFTMASLAILILTQAFGKTVLANLSPVFNADNLLVLLVPLMVIFGVVFFLTLLDQMKFSLLAARYGVIALLVVLVWQPLAANIFTRSSPLAYPPYYPPEIQQVSGWMKPGELMMSDMPWAVAWYGQRQCLWLTRDAQTDFYAINDYLAPVKGIYFSSLTMDDKFLSNLARGEADSWGRLMLNAGMMNQYPNGFPLKAPKFLSTGMFLTDRQRWPKE
ncbi:MAG TPA: glycosyltransferase family 39 protein, partial [bacterium]|nr:glycosyltransferase family 39 protein [bacterium]